MIHTTSSYKEKVKKNRVFYCQANIQLSDGTSFDVGNEDIMSDGWGYEEGVSDTNSFCIGAAVINQFELSLRNDDGHLNAYDFDGAVIRPKIGLRISDDTIETLPRGVYHSDPGNTQGATIRLTALDNMSLFEAPYSDVGTVFPAKLGTIVRDICQAKGVTLATQDFDYADYVVQDRPEAEDMTCLAMISYAAQISGCYAKCNTDGELELKWYDTNAFDGVRQIDGGNFDSADDTANTIDSGTFTDPATDILDGGEFVDAKYHHLYALSELSVCTDDVVITGIKVTDAGGNEYLYGSEGYVLSVEDNPLILGGQAEAVAAHLGEKIVGMCFRPLSCSALSDPSVEAGDAAYVTDRKGNSYACYLTNVSFSIGNYMKVSCDAETPSKNRSKQYSAMTKTIVAARKAAEKVVSAYDQQVKNVTSLISAGNGLYQTDVLQEDGSTITYLHDKPTVEESEYVYCRTSSGIMVSRDGGATWAVDKNGNALFNTIAAHGMSLDWLKSGSIEVRDSNGNIVFYANKDTGEVILSGGFKVDKSSLSSEISYNYPSFTSDDVTRIQKYITDPENNPLTDEELDKFDVNNDYRVTSSDLLAIQKMINGANPTYSKGKFSINLNSYKDAIVLEGVEGYMAGKKLRIGLGGMRLPRLTVDELNASIASLSTSEKSVGGAINEINRQNVLSVTKPNADTTIYNCSATENLRTVVVNFDISHPGSLSAGQWYHLLTVSAAPKNVIYFSGIINYGSSMCLGKIDESGYVQFYFPSVYQANQYISGSFTYNKA